ncbi:cell wall protein [Streptomyces sp. NPDC005568]|uniref:cell wall protein n=1 Tax=Streptomyces sp. NPDC005568 TaxID=3156887 RepID=UPI0033B9F854
MSAARRSLLTATAAGTLLGALWFVPSANATQDDPAQHSASMTRTSAGSANSSAWSDSSGPSLTSTSTDVTRTSAETTGDGDGDGTRLADTGGVDTTPYVVGGTLFLGLGAGFVAYSVRRERATAF